MSPNKPLFFITYPDCGINSNRKWTKRGLRSLVLGYRFHTVAWSKRNIGETLHCRGGWHILLGGRENPLHQGHLWWKNYKLICIKAEPPATCAGKAEATYWITDQARLCFIDLQSGHESLWALASCSTSSLCLPLTLVPPPLWLLLFGVVFVHWAQLLSVSCLPPWSSSFHVPHNCRLRSPWSSTYQCLRIYVTQQKHALGTLCQFSLVFLSVLASSPRNWI